MNIKNSLKHILFKLPRSAVNKFYLAYNFFRYFDYREKRICCGDLNDDKQFYVIRPRTDMVEGLMSLLLNVAKQINYALSNNYYPVVDFENYKTQYFDENIKIANSWEYYFLQPVNYSLDIAYKSKNVILSGLSALNKCDKFIDMSFDSIDLKKAHSFFAKYILINRIVNDRVLEFGRIFDPKCTLGLYLRGTDYVALKPAGHYIQPKVEDAINKADEIINEFGLKKVLLVTEDGNIFNMVKKHYNDMLICLPFDRFIDNYTSRDFLSKDININKMAESPYERGLNYLIKILLLSTCHYFVGGKTCGSWAACIFSKGFKKSFLFDLGIY